MDDSSREVGAFGWRVVTDDKHATVHDETGAVQARIERTKTKNFTGFQAGWVEQGATTPMHLPDGTVSIVNGMKAAMRRSKHNGHAVVRGRRYEFVHESGRRSGLLRDGRRIADLRRTGFRTIKPVAVTVRSEIDRTDQLMIVVAQQCIRAGRDGAISAVLDGLSI